MGFSSKVPYLSVIKYIAQLDFQFLHQKMLTYYWAMMFIP